MPMEISTEVIGQMTKPMVTALISTLMGPLISAAGKMTVNMVMVLKSGQMVRGTKGSMPRGQKMVMGC